MARHGSRPAGPRVPSAPPLSGCRRGPRAACRTGPVAEQRPAQSHHGRPLGQRHLQVVGHPHRPDGQVQGSRPGEEPWRNPARDASGGPGGPTAISPATSRSTAGSAATSSAHAGGWAAAPAGQPGHVDLDQDAGAGVAPAMAGPPRPGSRACHHATTGARRATLFRCTAPRKCQTGADPGSPAGPSPPPWPPARRRSSPRCRRARRPGRRRPLGAEPLGHRHDPHRGRVGRGRADAPADLLQAPAEATGVERRRVHGGTVRSPRRRPHDQGLAPAVPAARWEK